MSAIQILALPILIVLIDLDLMNTIAIKAIFN